MLEILTPVAQQRHGYKYGQPLRVDKNSLSVVLPITRDTTINRDYVTWPETDKVFIFDTGKIDEMEADNQSEHNVFIRSGTLFKGATQERALQRSALLFPGKKAALAVRCVHASRGISAGSGVKYGGITPLDFDAQNYSHGYTFKDQCSTWSNVKKSTSAMAQKMGKVIAASAQSAAGLENALRSRVMRRSSHDPGMIGGSSAAFYTSNLAEQEGAEPNVTSDFGSSAFHAAGSDDLHTSFTEFAQHFDDVLSKVKLVENQAGLALITHAGVQTIEFFDHRYSWKALHESAVKRLGSSIVDTGDPSVFEYKPDAAVSAVRKVLALEFKENNIWTHRPSNGEPRVDITGLSADDYVGEAVEVGDRLIHLVLLRLAK